MSTQSAGGGTELDELYWTLSVRAGDLLAATPGVVQAGKQMEAAGKNVAAAAQSATTAVKSQASALRDATDASGTAAKATDTVTRATEAHAASHRELSSGLRATRTGLVQIALQSTQTNAAVGRLVEGMLLLGAGSTAVLGVAAAVAVLAKGYDLVTASSREAAAQLKAVDDVLAKRQQERAPVAVEQAQLNTELEKQADLEAKIAAIRALQSQSTFAKAHGFEGAQVDPQQLKDLLAQEAQVAILVAEAQRGVLTERVTSRVTALDNGNQALTSGAATADDLARRRSIIVDLQRLAQDTNLTLAQRVAIRAALAGATTAELDAAQKQVTVQRQLKDLALAAQDALASLTTSLADNALVALRRFDEETQRLIADAKTNNARPGSSPIDVSELARQRALARLGAQGAVVTAQTQDFLRPLQEQLQTAGEGTPEQQLKILNTLQQEVAARQLLLEASNTEHLNDQALLAVHTTLLDILKQRAAVTKTIADTTAQRIDAQAGIVGEAWGKEWEKKLAQARQASQDLARGIDDAVRAAVQLGEAFGGVDVSVGNILTGITDLATKVPDMAKQLDDLKTNAKDSAGNPLATTGSVITTFAGILGGAGALLSGLSSLFSGESDARRQAEEALRRTMEANTENLKRLTQKIGDLGSLDASGSLYAHALALVNQGVPSYRPSFGPVNYRETDLTALNARLATAGLTRQQLQDLAQSLGVQTNFLSNDLATLQASFKALGDALAKTELAQAAQTFAGQLGLLQDTFAAFDITDPLDQLKALEALVADTGGPGRLGAFEQALSNLPPEVAGALRKSLLAAFGGTPDGVGSPALKKALAGQNLDTAEGRAAALANLQALLLRLNLGPTHGGLQASDLGGLTGQQFEQTLLQLIDLIKKANGATGSSSNFTQTQSITEVSAGRMISTLLTIATVLQESLPALVANSTAIAGLLQTAFGASPIVSAPPIPSGGYLATTSTAGAGAVHVGALTVQVTPPAGVSDPAAFGAAVGAAAVRTIQGLNTALGRDFKLRQVLAGASTLGG